MTTQRRGVTIKPGLRAVLYLRLSVQDDASTGIERQEADLVDEAAKLGLNVVLTLVDDGFSGAKRREKADEALAMLRDNRADVLMVWKFDRWSRQGLPAVAELYEVLETHGKGFVAYKDSLTSDSPMFRIICMFLAEMAYWERQTIVERQLSSQAHLATVGRYRGGITPFGWMPVPMPDGQPGYRLGLDPVQAPILLEAVTRVVGGEVVAQVVDNFNARFNAENYPDPNHLVKLSPEGKGWEYNALRGLLRNPILRGMRKYRGEVVRGKDGLPIRPFDALVDDDVWYRLQDVLDKRFNPNLANKGVQPPHLLLGIAKCGYCGDNLTRKTEVSLGCSRRGKELPEGETKCPGVVISRHRLEAYVTGVFMDRLGSFPILEEETVESKSAELLEIEEALDEVSAKLRELDDDDEMEEDRLSRQMRSLKKKRKELRSLPVEPVIRVVKTGETFAQRWSRSDDDERRELLMTVMEVRVAKGVRGRKGMDTSRVTISWKTEM